MSIARLMLIRYTSSREEAAALGYVNPGEDRRFAGKIGELAGRVQSELSFKSTILPTKNVERLLSGTLIEIATAPKDRVHISIAVPRKFTRGKWDTLRFGWRYDPNWGDERSIGYNPNPHIIGGYIFDAVLKLDADQTFIEGYRHG